MRLDLELTHFSFSWTVLQHRSKARAESVSRNLEMFSRMSLLRSVKVILLTAFRVLPPNCEVEA